MSLLSAAVIIFANASVVYCIIGVARILRDDRVARRDRKDRE